MIYTILGAVSGSIGIYLMTKVFDINIVVRLPSGHIIPLPDSTLTFMGAIIGGAIGFGIEIDQIFSATHPLIVKFSEKHQHIS
jgi:hypothetical protein